MAPIRPARLWLAIGVLLASTSPLEVLAAPSLAEMVVAATSRNPEMKLAGAQMQVADALQRKAAQPLAGDPTANIRYQTDAIGENRGYREWEGGIDLPLWLPGQADAYTHEAGRTGALSDLIGHAKHLEIAGDVRERLWAAAIARSEIEQTQAAVELARKLAKDVQRRVEAGELPRSDLLLVEKEVLQREETLHTARSRAASAERLFNRYTGLDTPREPEREQPPSQTELSDSHPQLLLAHGEVERARAHRDRVASERRSGPNLWLGGKTSRAESGYAYDSSVGIELSVPFGNSAHSAPALAEAEAALTQTQVEHSRARLALQDALIAAQLELEYSRGALARTQRRQDLADESLKMNRRAFDLGETDLVRLLQAQADALAARYDHQIRNLQHSQIIARLNQALGVVPQ